MERSAIGRKPKAPAGHPISRRCQLCRIYQHKQAYITPLSRTPQPTSAPPPIATGDPRERGGTGRSVERAPGADCAVGSGEWAEPPHSPWTLRFSGAKIGIFCLFLVPEKGSFLGGRSVKK